MLLCVSSSALFCMLRSVPHNRLQVPNLGNTKVKEDTHDNTVTPFSQRTAGQEAVKHAWQRPGAAPGLEHKQFEQGSRPFAAEDHSGGPLHEIDWEWSVLDTLRGALGRGESPDEAASKPSPARLALRAASDDGAPFGATAAVQDDDVLKAFHSDTGASKAAQVLLEHGAAPLQADVCRALSTPPGQAPPTNARLMADAKEAWIQYFLAEGTQQVAVREAMVRLQAARNTAAAAEEEWAFLAALAKREAQALPSASPAAYGKSLGGAAFRGFEQDDAFDPPPAWGAPPTKQAAASASNKQMQAAAAAAAAASKLEVQAIQAAADLAAAAPALSAPPATFTLEGGVAWGHGPILVLGSGLGHASIRLAEALRNTTVLSVAWPAAIAPGSAPSDLQSPAELHGRLKRIRGVHNNPIVQAGVHISTMATLHAAHVPWGAVLLDDLQRMTGSLLHDEFTELLGSILALSRRTVFLQGKLPDTRFFSYWGSLADLVEAAAGAADLSVSMRSAQEGAVGWGRTPRQVAIVSVQTADEAAAEDRARSELDSAAAAEAAASKRKSKAGNKLPGAFVASDDGADVELGAAPRVQPLPADCLTVDVAAVLRGAGLPVVGTAGSALFHSHLPHKHHLHVPSLVAALLQPVEALPRAAAAHAWEEEEEGSSPGRFHRAAGAEDRSLLPLAPPTEWMDLSPALRSALQVRGTMGWADGVPLSLLQALGLLPADAQRVMGAVALPQGAPGQAYHPPGTPPSHLLWAGERIVGMPPLAVAPPLVPRRISQHTAVQPVLPSQTPPPPVASVLPPAPRTVPQGHISTAPVPHSSHAPHAAAGAVHDRPAMWMPDIQPPAKHQAAAGADAALHRDAGSTFDEMQAIGGIQNTDSMRGRNKAADGKLGGGGDKATDGRLGGGGDKTTHGKLGGGGDKATDSKLGGGGDKATDSKLGGGGDKATDSKLGGGGDKATDSKLGGGGDKAASPGTGAGTSVGQPDKARAQVPNALRGKGAGRRHLSLPDDTALMRGTVLSGDAGSAGADASGPLSPAEVLRTVASATQLSAAGAGDEASPAAALGEILPPAYFAAAAVAAADASLSEVQPVGVGPAEAAADAAWAHRVRHAGEGRSNAQWRGPWETGSPGAAGGALLRGAWGWLRHELGRLAVADAEGGLAPRRHASILVSGAAAGVLSSKVARAFPSTLVLAALGNAPEAQAQSALGDMLGQDNVLLLQSDIHGAPLANLVALQDPLAAHVSDVAPLLSAVQLAGSPDAAVDALAYLLGAASSTMLLLPPWPVLLHAMSLGLPGTPVSPGDPPRGQHPPCDTHTSRNPAALLEALGVYGADHAHALEEDQPGAAPRSSTPGDAFGYPLPTDTVKALHDFSVRFRGGATDALWSPSLVHVVHAYAGRTATASRSQCDVAAGHPCACVAGLQSEAPYRQLAAAAAKQAGLSAPHITVHTVDLPGSTLACPHHLLALRVDAGEWGSAHAAAPQPPALPEPFAPGQSQAAPSASRAGVSLYTLTTLGASAAVRRDALRLYLSLPLPRIARAMGKANAGALPPWHVRVFLGSDGALRMSAGVPRPAGGARWFAAARGAGLKPAQVAATDAWAAIQGVLSTADTSSGGPPGTFSYLELGSGLGATALPVAAAHPHATVVSIEDSRIGSDVQLATSLAFGLNNALVCRHAVDGRLVKDLAASPEFFRFLHLATPLTELLAEQGRTEVAELVTGALQVGATSMLHVPGAELLSLGMASVFAPPAPPAEDAFRLAAHPAPRWAAAEWRLITELVKPPSSHDFSVRVRVLPSGADSGSGGYGVRSPRAWGRLPQGTLSSGVVRVDITNMTRPVNHHFQSEIDGHDRKYVLHVTANGSVADGAGGAVAALGNHPNDGGRIGVHLTRAKDKAGIPYTTLHGVTLIALLRLGLLAPLKARAYHQFVALPLYQDMAPWNIVFLGDALDYIDFDTRDRTFDHVVPAAFEVMEVLFNYKRTVEDFKRCGSKAPNLYNFPFLSDCVGSEVFRGPCPDTGKHVPCGDGKCHSDYISCLRAMSNNDMASGKAGWRHSVASTRLQLVETAASALKQDAAGALAAAAVGGEALPAPPAQSPGADTGKRSADLGHGELRFENGKYAA